MKKLKFSIVTKKCIGFIKKTGSKLEQVGTSNTQQIIIKALTSVGSKAQANSIRNKIIFISMPLGLPIFMRAGTVDWTKYFSLIVTI